MTPLEILKAARALISEPERWTRRANARDAQGRHLPPWSSDAVCFCAAGALERVAAPAHYGAYRYASEELSRGLKYSVTHFNDHGSHRRVLARFDRAIARLEKNR